jgi:hypothetical protein
MSYRKYKLPGIYVHICQRKETVWNLFFPFLPCWDNGAKYGVPVHLDREGNRERELARQGPRAIMKLVTQLCIFRLRVSCAKRNKKCGFL